VCAHRQRNCVSARRRTQFVVLHAVALLSAACSPRFPPSAPASLGSASRARKASNGPRISGAPTAPQHSAPSTLAAMRNGWFPEPECNAARVVSIPMRGAGRSTSFDVRLQNHDELPHLFGEIPAIPSFVRNDLGRGLPVTIIITAALVDSSDVTVSLLRRTCKAWRSVWKDEYAVDVDAQQFHAADVESVMVKLKQCTRFDGSPLDGKIGPGAFRLILRVDINPIRRSWLRELLGSESPRRVLRPREPGSFFNVWESPLLPECLAGRPSNFNSATR
jgi:hypothetical protein